MKFGGTSVGSAESHRQTADIILEQAQHWDRLAVVISAIRGVTDALISGARTAASGDGQTYRAIVSDLRVRHYRVVDELLTAAAERAKVLASVDEYLDEFATLCHSVHVLGELTPRALDTISSLGSASTRASWPRCFANAARRARPWTPPRSSSPTPPSRMPRRCWRRRALASRSDCRR
jgi:aspartokinase